MNPYPAKHSVLVMDNARIHHNNDLVATVEDIGGKILYLPSYSPDLNPIETAFSAMKSWLKRYRDFADYFNPKYLISVALAQTTSEMAKNYFEKSNYL
jgi:transposase